jgi:hypothetical protein
VNASCTASIAETTWELASLISASSSLRSLMSRTPPITSSPCSVSYGDRLISTGNSLPSLRRPCSSRCIAPINRVFGAAVYDDISRWWRGRTWSGTSTSIDRPTSSPAA